MGLNTGIVVACFWIAALTMPVGIGGGILFTPLLSSVHLSSKPVALTQVLITGASLATMILMYRRWTSAPDYTLMRVVMKYVYMTLPALLSGVQTGVYASKILPSLFLMVGLCGVCTYGAVVILKRAVATYKTENEEFAKKSLETGDVVGKELKVFNGGESAGAETAATVEPVTQEELIRFVKYLASFFFGTLLILAIRGGKGNKSLIGITPCGPIFILLVLAQIVGFQLLAFKMGPNDKEYLTKSWVVAFVTTFTGAAPGVLLNPLMMSYGITPLHAAEISTITTFLTASLSAIDFLLSGSVSIAHIPVSLVTFVGAFVGVYGVGFLIKKTGRQSILIFLLGSLAALGGFSVFLSTVTGTISKINNGDAIIQWEPTCN